MRTRRTLTALLVGLLALGLAAPAFAGKKQTRAKAGAENGDRIQTRDPLRDGSCQD